MWTVADWKTMTASLSPVLTEQDGWKSLLRAVVFRSDLPRGAVMAVSTWRMHVARTERFGANFALGSTEFRRLDAFVQSNRDSQTIAVKRIGQRVEVLIGDRRLEATSLPKGDPIWTGSRVHMNPRGGCVRVARGALVDALGTARRAPNGVSLWRDAAAVQLAPFAAEAHHAIPVPCRGRALLPLVTLNPAFLADALSLCAAELLHLHIYAPTKPVYLRDENALACIMPLDYSRLAPPTTETAS